MAAVVFLYKFMAQANQADVAWIQGNAEHRGITYVIVLLTALISFFCLSTKLGLVQTHFPENSQSASICTFRGPSTSSLGGLHKGLLVSLFQMTTFLLRRYIQSIT